MSEISELILLLNKQHQEQMAVLCGEHQEQITMLQEQLKILQSSLNNPRENVPTPMASFQPFDSTSELWTDYLARFRTFVTAISIPDNKQAQIFLTNQSNSVYKMLSNLAAQQQPVESIHELTMNDIETFMAEQFDPKRFVVRERFKFWSDMKRKPVETIPELASRIRQDAAKCDFLSIKDPLDEALRTNFICSVDNEAVLKTLFKLKDDELKFSNAIRVAQEVEEAANVAKETVHGQPSTSVQKVYHAKSKTSKTQEKKTACFRCGNSGHFSKACPHIKAICSFCKKTGHLQSVSNQSSAIVILLQETHYTDAEKLVLPNYQLAGSSLSRKLELATFLHERLKYTFLDQFLPTSEIEWLCVDVDGYKIINNYKPSPKRLRTLDLPVFPQPCLYAASFYSGRWNTGTNPDLQ